MEADSDASESDAADPDPDPSPVLLPAPPIISRSASTRRRRVIPFVRRSDRRVAQNFSSSRALSALFIFVVVWLGPLGHFVVRGDALENIRSTGRLRYGSDMEGGGPYAYPDPSSPRRVTGFEVELMAELAKDVGATPEFSQGQWDKLLQVLDSGRIDSVVNGYEWTEQRARDYLATRPYYVYQFQLIVRRDSPITAWCDVKGPKPGGGLWTVAVLGGSAADTFADEKGVPHVQVVRFDGSVDAMTAVQNGQYDATLQDVPAARFYSDRFPGLVQVGPPESRGYYVIYVRNQDQALRDVLDRGLARLIASGELRRLYEKYGIWTEAQSELLTLTGPLQRVSGGRTLRGWSLLRRYRSRLMDAALVTLKLSLTSMPLAMALGLLIAIGRLYGPRPLRTILSGYVELLRGTPLMLQLFVLFYLLKLPPWVAGIAGLAINYSAYEAEIYRAGLQAIPTGQMEAALALGMSRAMALRRVIVPQAVRIVIPPVTNDFIALFKDTSVCSVITLVELTKEYSILAQSAGGAIEFALAVAAIYMVMSLPLSWFSRWSERRLSGDEVKGGAVA
jgi:polar amino acid transport system substrate-binding protein